LVVIRSESGPVLAAAAILYMLPLALFFGGYALGATLWGSGGLIGGIAFALGILIAALYDRYIGKKKKTEYTITGYGQMPDNLL
jgi:positive regulator of sigma E activity